jgi:hypothetical protein
MSDSHHHRKATKFAGHQIDLTEHKDGGRHKAAVRHPEYHEVIHTTAEHKSQNEALLAAKQWIHTTSPQAYRSRRGGNLFKAECDAIDLFFVSNRDKKQPMKS